MPIHLLLGVHAHQPVGNFPAVIDDAHERCYRPFLQTLHRYPDFRFAAHFSGWLLDYLLQRYPADMALLQEMVARGQAEMFGSGDCEPVLAAIPNRDRLGQINVLSDRIERHFGVRPKGAWLTERVWEGTVVPALADTGIDYVAVDDYHFLCTGRTEAELDSFYTTEEDGRRLDLFPISEQMRYRLPFSPAREVVSYLEWLADQGHSAAIYFDDIEKFGIWPETYEWVYNKRWLEDFLSGVLASPKIITNTYADYHRGRAPRGVAYLPTTSYIEMNEWTLPAPAAHAFADLLQREKESGRLEVSKPHVRGGIWRNFFSRYPESNWMHKRMLGLSARLAATPQAPAELRDCLYRAQANDAYWHGLFGGLYLPHLRRAVWDNLVELEGKLDALAPRPAREQGDTDLDGKTETFLHNALLQAVLKDDGQGALTELDSYALAHNFGDSLRRSDEHYYRKMNRAPATEHHGDGIASAHDRVDFKHDIHPEDVVPDSRPRALFLDTWTPDIGAPVALESYRQTDAADGPEARLAADLGGLQITKTYRLSENRLEIEWQFAASGISPGGQFCTELNLAMPSCDGYGGRYVLADGSIPCGFGQELVLSGMARVHLDDSELGGRLSLSASCPVNLRAAPHFTVSQSEAGFEKVMQAVNLKVCWPVTAGTVKLSLEVARGA